MWVQVPVRCRGSVLVATQHGCLACRRVELANFEFSSNGVIDVARTTSDLPTTLPVDIPGVLAHIPTGYRWCIVKPSSTVVLPIP